ncbi:MAG: nucleotidyltransferase domain-containing protein [Meiothermus silvanus]|nr:nucleotidyltransferase domain-containing protein [Allomeiothermus silvanus]
MGRSLTDAFLAALVEEFAPPDCIGVGLVGSFARGQGKPFSDIDLDFFVPEPPPTRPQSYTLRHRSGHLVSLKTLTLETQRSELHEPQHAIWAVPGMRQMRILHDPQGHLQQLKAEAQAFRWEPLQAAADAFVSYEVMTSAEEVHKILGGLEAGTPSQVIYATLGLGLGTATLMAVHRRLLVESENRYFEQLYQALGSESPWARAHRLAVGWKAGAFKRRGIAALRLYWETFKEVQEVIEDDHLEVIQPVLQTIQKSGYLETRV